MHRPLLPVVLAAAMGLAGIGCGAQPVSPAACQATAPVRTGNLLTVSADPSESSIRGVLPGAAPAEHGQPYPVRWLVDARKASDQIRIQAAREGTGDVYRQSFPSSGTSGLLAEFPSQLVFPAPGCWDADVFTGTAVGSLTFRVD
jgi:hypothetical protein